MKNNEPDDLATEKISLRCPPSLKNQIAQAAKKEGRKPSQWIVFHLQQLLDESAIEEKPDRAVPPLESVEFDTPQGRKDRAK